MLVEEVSRIVIPEEYTATAKTNYSTTRSRCFQDWHRFVRLGVEVCGEENAGSGPIAADKVLETLFDWPFARTVSRELTFVDSLGGPSHIDIVEVLLDLGNCSRVTDGHDGDDAAVLLTIAHDEAKSLSRVIHARKTDSTVVLDGSLGKDGAHGKSAVAHQKCLHDFV